MSSSDSPNVGQGKTILELDIDELENACKHLERSNKELKEFMKDEPSPALEAAIEENKIAIESKRKEIERLKMLLLQGQSPHMLASLADTESSSRTESRKERKVPVLLQNEETKDEASKKKEESKATTDNDTKENDDAKDSRYQTGLFL
mmetsp:Transcript_6181/g.7110  ORF Transcript_6181/g.7110 Transcript_6181/m.7110 type:complete len:149 (+) Transcript_6181:189-635(+)|eukprot:CAMPEP_0184024198 /NCGR_PEP_ID=MMETSP0954-20121128/11910_1 /TAXON_ID=627963 /ORGANISM="Aplanochytrium sp, Strain PBS07" /LENGTH=148 /DNA_ID=CAMNT_0026307421 /DNA_START=204 /DNA_END=650 /DNA_ORIENTATION=-